MSDITVNNFKAFYEQIRPYLGAVHSGFTPVGTVIAYFGETAPQNYLACDGTAYNKSAYPELWAHLSSLTDTTPYVVSGDNTKFKVPDLRGEFIRGWGTNSHANQGNGANVGVHQDGTKFFGGCDSSRIGIPQVSPSDYETIITNAHRIYTSSSATDENGYLITSRPTNTSLMFVIASKNIFMDAGSNYSTEEQVVGTWIDGKPIYQKVIKCGKLSSSGTTLTVNHNIENVKFIRVVGAWASQSGPDFISGGTEMIPNTNTSNDFIGRVTSNLTAITIRQMNDWQAYHALVIVQYTKTTD